VTISEWVAASRARQGLPPKVSDPRLIAEGVAILRAMRPRRVVDDRTPHADEADHSAPQAR
jgi:hypothetical protein